MSIKWTFVHVVLLTGRGIAVIMEDVKWMPCIYETESAFAAVPAHGRGAVGDSSLGRMIVS